jgi:hypothetical protein
MGLSSLVSCLLIKNVVIILDPACVSLSPIEPDPPEVVLRLGSKRVEVEAEAHPRYSAR